MCETRKGNKGHALSSSMVKIHRPPIVWNHPTSASVLVSLLCQASWSAFFVRRPGQPSLSGVLVSLCQASWSAFFVRRPGQPSLSGVLVSLLCQASWSAFFVRGADITNCPQGSVAHLYWRLTPEHRRRHCMLAHRHQNWNHQHWSHLLFADESIISLYKSNGCA